MLVNYLSLLSLRTFQAKMFHIGPDQRHQQSLDRTKTQYRGISAYDLRFLGCQLNWPEGDPVVANFISSNRQLQSLVLDSDMNAVDHNSVSEVPVTEYFKPIGQVITYYCVVLEDTMQHNPNHQKTDNGLFHLARDLFMPTKVSCAESPRYRL